MNDPFPAIAEQAATEAALTPVQADGTLDRAILANRRSAYQKARLLARAIAADRPVFATDVEHSASAFAEHAIGKMVTICRAIRAARRSTS